MILANLCEKIIQPPRGYLTHRFRITDMGEAQIFVINPDSVIWIKQEIINITKMFSSLPFED